MYKIGDKFEFINGGYKTSVIYKLICTKNKNIKEVIAIAVVDNNPTRWVDSVEVENLFNITQEELDLILKCDTEDCSFIKI